MRHMSDPFLRDTIRGGRRDRSLFAAGRAGTRTQRWISEIQNRL